MPPAPPATIVGSYLSPYVRKVLVCLHEKGVPYTIDPIVPFFGDERFSRASPLRRIPVLLDDAVTLCDSSVICQYLEERYPDPPLLPRDVAGRARARWLEEYADTRMGDVFIWRLFNQRVIGPFVWGQPTDEAVVAQTLATDVPGVLDYLEAQAPAAGFLCGDCSIADVSIAVFFRNAAFAGWTIDAGRWPRVAALVGRTFARESFRRLVPFEDLSLRTPLPRHRDALAAAGAPIAAATWGTATPRRGMMRT